MEDQKPKSYRNPHRVTRSITIKNELFTHLKKRSAKEGRSINWLVNELVAKDVKHK